MSYELIDTTNGELVAEADGWEPLAEIKADLRDDGTDVSALVIVVDDGLFIE